MYNCSMRERTLNNQGDFSLLKIGVLAMFVGLSVLVAYLWFKTPSTSNQVGGLGKLEKGGTAQESKVKDTNDISWEKYINTEFGFEFNIPRLLLKRELRGQGGYELFVRFEENKFSGGKGVGLGINLAEFSAEVDRLKKDLEGQKGKLTKEEDIEIAGHKAKYLEYEPENNKEEKRGVLIIPKEAIVISISSVPEQIPKIVASFKFLN